MLYVCLSYVVSAVYYDVYCIDGEAGALVGVLALVSGVGDISGAVAIWSCGWRLSSKRDWDISWE